MRLALALVLAVTAQAAADSRPDLRLKREPAPRHLRMRPKKRAAVTSPGGTPDAAPAVPPAPDAPPPTKFDPSTDAIGLVRDLRRPISARFSMGYVVDGTALTGEPTHSGRYVRVEGETIPGTGNVARNDDFRRLRAYALGEGYFSSRGVLLPSMSTYFATRFQIASPLRDTEIDPMTGAVRERLLAPPIANWFDRTGVTNRAAWIELKDFLDDKQYAPLRLRAGQLYVYGPWMLHMYGAVAAWDGKLARLSVYGGSRVPDYTLIEVTDRDRSGIFGASARVDLRHLKQKIPFAFGVEMLQFTARGAATDTASQHALLQLDWRPRADFALVGQARVLDRELANEQIQLRSRYKQVTNLVFDFTYRHDNDWRWDPSVVNPDPLQARRYLDLGPVVPQMIMSGRAGTLIKENVDVLLRGAVADDRVNSDAERNTFTNRYAEIGGGFEVRLRRTVGLGFTALSRQTKRYQRQVDQIKDVPGQTESLPRPYSPAVGERGFTEMGTSLRMSLGARRFSALVEGYGRRTRYSLVYCDAGRFPDGTPDLTMCTSALDTGVLDEDYRFGGRVTIDAWIGQQLRLFASYELSSRIDLAPELTGYKSLRLMMEGVY